MICIVYTIIIAYYTFQSIRWVYKWLLTRQRTWAGTKLRSWGHYRKRPRFLNRKRAGTGKIIFENPREPSDTRNKLRWMLSADIRQSPNKLLASIWKSPSDLDIKNKASKSLISFQFIVTLFIHRHCFIVGIPMFHLEREFDPDFT